MEKLLIEAELTALKSSLLGLEKQEIRLDDIPSFYFEHLAESTIRRYELQQHAPILADLAKKRVESADLNQKLPPLYFENLEAQIFERLKTADFAATKLRAAVPLARAKSTSIQRIKLWTVALAAAAIIVGVVFFAQSTVILPEQTKASFSSISKNEAKAYLAEHTDELDETLLAEHVEHVSLTKMVSISEMEVVNYLDETNSALED